ncbi:hypothetical protein HOLleu_28029 [Holothuria leucospilota]|uniref:Ig-like domain-containing protein n=1 Tax=Holothuria leucospilota TaxID=206669 RepID=A0A9Q1BRA6_HOLLE|nr:hypothetical protein HOLleu_28029 [Holothuria leucospilota]
MACTPFYEVVFVCVVLSNLGRSEPISFGIVNPKENQIIFEGEENVTMECKVAMPQNASVKIVLGENVVAHNDHSGNVVQYVIRRVSLEDNGYYACLVTYQDNVIGRITESENFHLVVKNTRPQCIYNTESTDAFSVGAEVIVSCYCMALDACKWNAPEKSNTSFEIYEEVTNGEKFIVRLLVGPLSIDDNDIIFHCSNGPPDSQGCSIGPMLVLPTETNEVTTEPYLVLNTRNDKPEERTILTILIIILIFILILLLVRFLMCLCCKKKERFKHKKLPRKEEETVMLETEPPVQPHIEDRQEQIAELEDKPPTLDLSDDASEHNSLSDSMNITVEPEINQLNEDDDSPEYDKLPPQPVDRLRVAPQSPKPTDDKETFGSFIWKSVSFLNFHKALYD